MVNMPTNLFYKYSDFSLINTPNDVTISLTSYLVDAANAPFINANTSGLDFFTVETLKTSLPVSGYDQFLAKVAANAIRTKYNKAVAGSLTSGSSVVTGISDTSGIIPGQLVRSEGIISGTIVQSVKDKTSIRLSSAATSTLNTSLTISIDGWNISFSEIITLASSVVNFALI